MTHSYIVEHFENVSSQKLPTVLFSLILTLLATFSWRKTQTILHGLGFGFFILSSSFLNLSSLLISDWNNFCVETIELLENKLINYIAYKIMSESPVFGHSHHFLFSWALWNIKCTSELVHWALYSLGWKSSLVTAKGGHFKCCLQYKRNGFNICKL